MKKLLALCSTLLLAITVHAAQFEEGKHYKVLDAEKAAKPTVTEFSLFTARTVINLKAWLRT